MFFEGRCKHPGKEGQNIELAVNMNTEQNEIIGQIIYIH